MRILLDTNVLLRSVQRSHPAFPSTRRAVGLLFKKGNELCIAPQNIAEFWNVCTRPRAVNGLGFGIAATERHTARLERVLTLLPDSLDSFRVWRRLILDHEISGAKVHDARLAAVMQVHEVAAILTFNVADFKRFKDVTALHPDDVLQGDPD